MKKHVLITGGAGFIGSHLCDEFLRKGYLVTAVDNLLTGRKENLNAALKSPDFSLIEHDVCKPLEASLFPLIARNGLHGVLHFACPASPVDFDKIPFKILEVDSIGTIETVKLTQKYDCRYLLASTSEVYGDPLVHPQPESYWGNVNPNGPRACYDETKRFAEAYVSTAVRLSNLNAGIVRIFNTYGPRMRIDDGRIVPELCRQALNQEALTLHGNGKQTRSFCYVSDLVEGIIRLFESEEKHPVNIGNPVERTVLDFAEAVLKATNGQSSLEYLPAREDDPKRRCPDITRAEKILKWKPQVQLEEGLKRSVEYFRTQL